MYLKNLGFKGIKNARDFGGIVNSEGKTIKYRCFIRSSELSKASDEDVRILTEEYGLSKIIDLRTGIEKNEKPDRKMKGVEYIENPLFTEARMGVTKEKKSLEGKEMLDKLPDMCALYRDLVTDEFSVAQLKNEFDIIINHKDSSCLLWHCTEGKDRCGITSALFLSILDVDRETIFEDYVFTSTVSKKKASKLYFLIKYIFRRPKEAKIVKKIFMADPDFLTAAFDTFDEVYGGVDNFIREELGISDSMKDDFKKRFLQ